MNSTPPGGETRKRAGLLQYRTDPKVLGTVLAYRPGNEARDLWYELCHAYRERFGDKKKDVQPPYRSLEAILRAVLGDWAHWDVTDAGAQLITGSEISDEDRLDVFDYWGEAILPEGKGRDTVRRLADLIAQTSPIAYPDLPRPIAGRRTMSWWPGELTRWRLAQDLARIDWKLGTEKPIRFTLCTDGSLAAIGHELPSVPDRQRRIRHLLPRIRVGTAATGHSARHAVTVTAVTTLLANRWYEVSTVLLTNPDQPLAVAARTDGPPWNRRLNVPAVAASRRLAALPRLSKRLPPFPESLDDSAIAADTPLGTVRAVAPKSITTPGLGRGSGMELFRLIEEHIDTHLERYKDRTPLYIEVPDLSVPTAKTGVRVSGPILPQDVPASMDAAQIDTLLVVVLWHTDEVRSRLQSEIARQWELGENFVAPDNHVVPNVVQNRIHLLFLQDKDGALAHGPASTEHRRRQLDELLAPHRTEGMTITTLCETNWDPEHKYATTEEKEKAEAEDGKWLSKAALARLDGSSQYIKQAPPPVPLYKKNGEPCSPKYIERETKARDGAIASSTENALRDMFRGLGLADHRLGAAFGALPLHPWWHIGIHVRRHAQRRQYGQRNAKPAPLTITLTAIRPVGGPTDPWTIWAYSPATSRWQHYRTTRLAVHATELGLDVSTFPTVGDESHQASAAAQITEAALMAARTQLPFPGPSVIYVNGDTTEYIWAGLRDENIGQPPPLDLPRPASWLPGYGLPRAQRPLAVVRTITDLDRIGRPTGAYVYDKNGRWRRTQTTNSPFQLASDDGATYLPDFLLVTVPRTYAAGPSGRFAADHSRFDNQAIKRQGKNAYAHTAVRLTVLPLDEDADTDLIGKIGTVMINQGISWDGRQTEATPLRLARQIDTDHPHYRRSTNDEQLGADQAATMNADETEAE
ncbi:RNaseH domain-containing protein [Streptomyces sp. CC208A]|uniref:RNaseH domain-containing protein n=1 Tax=Streptomyces sp. CC208A TaxID=3044573 RepID=UPI0024A90539|nr:RNaseH domain-containing protein [Streptomyces sp. CC208A]